MMRTELLVVLLFVAVTLAGCAEEAEPLDTQQALASGLGGIRGILVDDRFRPLELTDQPRTEFQVDGFIILQETGEQLRTTANGEFESAPLEPGRYTLRFNIDGHEVVPQTVTVAAGEVSETTVVARRTVSSADLIIQDEFAIFIPCTISFIVSPMQADCIPDMSEETTRYVFRMELDENDAKRGANFLLTEMLLNKDAGNGLDGSYMMQIEGDSAEHGDGVTSYNYAVKFINEGKYDRVLLQKGVESEWQEDPLLTYGVWEDTTFVRWRFWGQGWFQQELASTLNPVIQPHWSIGYGAGVQLGMKATVLASMFFTEDPTIPENFCGLCGDLN